MRAGSTENFLDSNLIQQVFRKNLSVEALNERLRKRFMEFDDPRDRKRTTIPLVDALMSGFAMFTLKIPSMLALDKYRMSDEHIGNLKSLFGIEKVPSDTTMREILDEVDPDQLRIGFKDVFHQLQRSKALEDYFFWLADFWRPSTGLVTSLPTRFIAPRSWKNTTKKMARSRIIIKCWAQ